VSNFEERLLVELREIVKEGPTARGRRRRLPAPRVALAGGLAAAVLAAAVVAGVFLLSAGTPAAYAVTENADGSVTVEIDSLTDASGLQAQLRAAGVPAVVVYLPPGKTCAEPWFTPAGAGGGTHSSAVGRAADGSTSFTIGGDVPAGETLVVSAQTGPGRAAALAVGWARGDVPPCRVVDAPAGSGPLGGPPVDGSTQSTGG